MDTIVAPRGQPLPWWECHGCQIPVDGDLARCPKCGTARLAICRTAGCERKPRGLFVYCDRHLGELLTRAMVGPPEAREAVTLAPGATPSRSAALAGRNRPRGASGQALVEFVLVLPILLTLLLSSVELWRIGYERTRYAESAGVIAELARFSYPSPEFDAAADDELARVGCDWTDYSVTDDGWRIVVDVTCQYRPIAYAALAVPVSVSAVR